MYLFSIFPTRVLFLDPAISEGRSRYARSPSPYFNLKYGIYLRVLFLEPAIKWDIFAMLRIPRIITINCEHFWPYDAFAKQRPGNRNFRCLIHTEGRLIWNPHAHAWALPSSLHVYRREGPVSPEGASPHDGRSYFIESARNKTVHRVS